MYRKFDVTGIFYLYGTFFLEVNTAQIIWLKVFYRTYHPEAAVKW
jgi:hypothetical protein